MLLRSHISIFRSCALAATLVVCLVGARVARAQEAGGGQPGATPPSTAGDDAFETFTIPRPKSYAPPPTPTSSDDSPDVQGGPTPTGSNQKLNLTSTLSLSPWDQSLQFGADGEAGSRTFESDLHVDPRSNEPFFSAGYLALQQQESSVRMGRGNDELLGGVSGLSYTLQRTKGVSLASGVYLLSSGYETRIVPGFDAHEPVGKSGSVGELFAADGSWRAYAGDEWKNLTAYAHFGSLASSGGPDWSSYLAAQLPAGIQLSERLAGQNGDHPYGANETLLLFHLGRGMFSADSMATQESGESTSERLGSLFLPIGRTIASLRYGTVTTNTAGSPSETNTLWDTTLWRTLPRGRMIWAGLQANGAGQPGWHVGGSTQLIGRNSFQLEVGQQPGGALSVQQLSLGIPAAFGFDLALQYGVVVGQTGMAHTGWNMNITHSFSWAPGRMGSINGRVAPLGGSLPAGVRIVLDDHRRIPVDATGRFTVKKVEQGSHRLRLDLTRVPAEWGAVVQEAEAIVRPGKPALVSFQVQRLASITGSVATLSPLPPDLAAVHPLNNLVISLKDSRRTTTDEEGHFHFDNLPAGTYIAELAETAVPDGFKPAGPTRWVLKVAPGGKVTDANFTLERKERPIIYTDLDSGESTSSTQAAAVAPRTNQGPAPDQAATLWPKPDTGGSNSRPSGTASQPPAQPIASVQGTANPG